MEHTGCGWLHETFESWKSNIAGACPVIWTPRLHPSPNFWRPSLILARTGVFRGSPLVCRATLGDGDGALGWKAMDDDVFWVILAMIVMVNGWWGEDGEGVGLWGCWDTSSRS